MTRVLTNNTTVSVSVEASLGVLESSAAWEELEPNDIPSYGATISKVARNPISKNRQNRKGTISNVESAVELDMDLTLSSSIAFIEGFAFSNSQGRATIAATSANATLGFVVASGATAFALQGAMLRVTDDTVAANNALHIVGAPSDDTHVVVAPVPTVSAAPSAIEVVGHRCAISDIELVETSGVFSLTSTVLDFTTLPIMVGQEIYIGGFADASQFGVVATPVRGLVRLKSIATNTLVFDKQHASFTATVSGSGITLDLLFGEFIRNVPTNHADFIERSYQFELTQPGLGTSGETMYEYAKGNMANEITFDLPLTEKATYSMAFVGQDTPPPTLTRANVAGGITEPEYTTAFNTSADIARLRVDQLDGSGLTTDFKSLSLTLNNNVSPENVLGVTGAKYINTGNLEVGFEATLIFSNAGVAEAVRNNTTLTMDFQLTNDNGTIVIDLPALTLGGGAKSFPVNESITIETTGEAFADPTLNTSFGITIFRHALPLDPANPFL